MQDLQKGDLINITVPQKKWDNVKAKFIKKNKDGEKMNVYVKGSLTWVATDSFQGLAESILKPSVEQKEGTAKPKVAELSTNASAVFDVLKEDVSLSNEQIGDMLGMTNEAVESAIKILKKRNLIKCDVDTNFELIIVDSAKQPAKVTTKKVEKINPDKPVKITKKQRVLALVAEGKSHKEVAEIVGSLVNYVREIVDVNSSDFKMPKEGTNSYKVMKELKKGKSIKEVVEITGMSNSLVNKVRTRMKSAQLI